MVRQRRPPLGLVAACGGGRRHPRGSGRASHGPDGDHGADWAGHAERTSHGRAARRVRAGGGQARPQAERGRSRGRRASSHVGRSRLPPAAALRGGRKQRLPRGQPARSLDRRPVEKPEQGVADGAAPPPRRPRHRPPPPAAARRGLRAQRRQAGEHPPGRVLRRPPDPAAPDRLWLVHGDRRRRGQRADRHRALRQRRGRRLRAADATPGRHREPRVHAHLPGDGHAAVAGQAGRGVRVHEARAVHARRRDRRPAPL
mmetsp:Transcript_16684/g.28403  ORF Transcript_16684/g.28403 Transcript_16684/m.28403 type:complete len:258 (-) Transcript_16684:663-1436(-)